LVWFEIMTNFQDKTQILCTFKNLYFSKFDSKKKWHIGATINTIYKKFQNISFENSSLGKYVFWEKGPQKGQ
jgi:uncharacterized protein (UPF0303 family)